MQLQICVAGQLIRLLRGYDWLIVHFNRWRYWDKITCPILFFRGAQSDFLTERLPHSDVIEFEGVGHTPALNATSQIKPILDWLDIS